MIFSKLDYLLLSVHKWAENKLFSYFSSSDFLAPFVCYNLAESEYFMEDRLFLREAL